MGDAEKVEEAIGRKAETTRPKIDQWKTLGQREYYVFKQAYTNYMLDNKEDQRPYRFVSEEVKSGLKVSALGRKKDTKYFDEKVWEALDGNTFWELCDGLFPGRKGIGELTQFINKLPKPSICSSEITHESKMREVFDFVAKILQYLNSNMISNDLESETAVCAMKSRLPRAIQMFLYDAMQAIIDESQRKRPAKDGGGFAENPNVIGTALQGLATMCMDSNLIGMKALLQHETYGCNNPKDHGHQQDNKNKGKDPKNGKDPKKKDRWPKDKKEAAKTSRSSLTCFQCGEQGHRSTDCQTPKQNAAGKAAQEAFQSARNGKEA
jgi:hypothetical protein